MRNPDPAPRRFTSLAWAAVLGHEETFEYLLSAGHDDEELSKDSENNTILMLLSDLKPSSSTSPYQSRPPDVDIVGAALRMSKLYYDRYTWILDWSNVHGKTALHVSALKGNEELVRMLCDLGADFNLSDNKGNTPLHYASSWGHIPVVQLLIERGCSYTARNNDGFTASDYAYSFNTRDTLQDTARIQFENNKKSRRQIFAQAAARGNEWGSSAPVVLPPPATKPPDGAARMRSGSGGSRTTATSDSGDYDGSNLAALGPSTLSASSSSSPSQPSPYSNGTSYSSGHAPSTSGNMSSATSSTGTFSVSSPGPPLAPPLHNPAAALSPIATRMRERDADAMEKYMRRNRSGSASTDTKSQTGSTFSSAGPSANGDDITSLSSNHGSGTSTPRKILRPSLSAAQLRSHTQPPSIVTTNVTPPDTFRSRAGTNPTAPRPNTTALSPTTILTRSSSNASDSRHDRTLVEEPEESVGPSVQFAKLPELPGRPGSPSPTGSTVTTPTGRRLPFNLLSKTLSSNDHPPSLGHRRGSSSTSIRGN